MSIGFILLKPEAIQRNITGKIINIIEEKGLKIVALKMLSASEKQIRELYTEWTHLPYFEDMIRCSVDSPVIAMIVEAPTKSDCSLLINDLQGKYDIYGTIRHRFVTHPSRNVIHCSNNSEDALRESRIFFSESEICKYVKVLDQWLTD